MMNSKLKGKVAIVTGGGRGIGRGITERFLEDGAIVVIAQRNSPIGTPPNDSSVFIRTDLSRADDITALVAATVKRFGGLDVLVNNAGIMFEKTVEEMSEADWDRMMDVNLKAPFLLTRSAVPDMRRRGGGSIINIGSIEGLASNPGHPAYSTSKAGIHGLTAAVAVDHGKDGIRCNAIAPGWINSDLSEAYIDGMPQSAHMRSALLALHPVGRLGEPRDVANLASWLACDESTFVTGQVFVVDGGRTKKLPLPVLVT
jgi:NAD(P)-dependent dehydrogenase (short-subunit alcohol dehydrogenase family)